LGYGTRTVYIECIGPSRAFLTQIQIADTGTVNDMRGLEFRLDLLQRGLLGDAKRPNIVKCRGVGLRGPQSQ